MYWELLEKVGTKIGKGGIAVVLIALSAILYTSAVFYKSRANAATLAELKSKFAGQQKEISDYRATIVVTEGNSKTRYEIYGKGCDKFKQVRKVLKDPEKITASYYDVSLQNGTTFESLGSILDATWDDKTKAWSSKKVGTNYEVYENCPPFPGESFYNSSGYSYDFISPLAILNSSSTVLLGEEQLGEKSAYKLEINKNKGSITRQLFWIDKKTNLLLRKEDYRNDGSKCIVDVESVEINKELSDAIFAYDLPSTSSDKDIIHQQDEGFRELSLKEIEQKTGFDSIEPIYLPDGFKLAISGWRDPTVAGLPGDRPPEKAPRTWYKPAYLVYRSGNLEVNIAEDRHTGGNDPDSLGIIVEDDGTELENVLIADGCQGYLVVSSAGRQIIFFAKNGIKFKIHSNLPYAELLSIAKSLI
jgi:outer membrane lipoprotein-sorting protein